ncbi:MAG: leucine-rich repeat protein [Clostridia bacterium]|nr:leucine-rich repeat protein [Clostridia bacterium]
MKKIISLILTAVMVVSLFAAIPFTAHAYDMSGKCGDNLNYLYDSSTGELVISGTGGMWAYALFYVKTSGVKTVTIENGVTSIGLSAFINCKELTSVSIPDSVIAIGDWAFQGCSRLESITIPNGVERIEHYVFRDCSSLKSVKLPSGLMGIGQEAFMNCSSLESISFPDSLTGFGPDAFCGCSSLESLYIPKNVNEICADTFLFCNGLTSIQVESGNTTFDSRENCNAIIRTSTDTLIKGCDNSFIPDGVKEIYSGAFYYCKGLTSITIPNSVIDIYNDAFAYCSSLTSLTIPSTVYLINSTAFLGCTGLTSIQVDSGNPHYDSRNNCNAIIETKANRLLLGCKNTTIPTTVETIGNMAFMECKTLTSIIIPNSVTTIDSNAFNGCTGLTSIVISNGVTNIADDAFSACTGLSVIRVTSGNTVYDSRGNCNALIKTKTNDLLLGCKNTVIPNTVKSIHENAFNLCRGLTKIVIPEGVTEIGNTAFRYCSDLKIISLPKSLTTVGANAFAGCKAITDVLYPESQSEWNKINFEENDIGEKSDYELRKANIHYYSGFCGENVWFEFNPDSRNLTIGGTGAMDDFTDTNPGYSHYINDVDRIGILDGVTSVGADAFYGYESARIVSIPASVTAIGNSAFLGCSAITDVYYSGTQVQWDDIDIAANNSELTGATLHMDDIKGKCGDNLNYSLNTETGTLTITGTGAMYDYDSDYAPWDDYRESIGIITISNGVTTIGKSAFMNTSITNIYFPESITVIGGNAFCNCAGLTEVVLPEGISEIEAGTFDGCTGLEAIVIPAGVTSVGNYAFMNNTALKSVTVPYSVTQIGDYAFRGCEALEDVYYPGSRYDWYQMNIGIDNAPLDNAGRHYGINNNTGTIGDNLTYSFDWETGTLTIGGTGALSDTESAPWRAYKDEITTIIIEDGVTAIGEKAFSACYFLKTVVIGSGITTIFNEAFDDCNRFSDVYYAGTEAEWNNISINPYWNSELLNATKHFGISGTYPADENFSYSFDPYTGTLTISGTGALPDVAPPWKAIKNDVKTVVIESGITRIGEEALYNHKNLKRVVFGTNVTSIGAYAFDICPALTDVYYGGGYADWNRMSIESHNEPLTNANIHYGIAGQCGDNAYYSFNQYTGTLSVYGSGDMYDYSADSPFESIKNLEKVMIGDGITSVGGWAFANCSTVTAVDLPTTLESIGENAFRSCNGLKNITIPYSVTSIGNSAFILCKGLTSVGLNYGLTSIGNNAFEGCSGLTSVEIPASLTNFGSYAFRYCENLARATFQNGLTTIGASFFQQCTGLTEVVIPDSVSTLETRAFAGCSNLTAVTIGTGVETIANGAFQNCTKIDTVNYAGTQEDWDAITIGSQNTALTNVKPQSSSGTCGENVSWHLNPSTGVLTISGTGAMKDYNWSASPFDGNFFIKTVIIEDGVTTVGYAAFSGCSNMTSVSLGKDITAVKGYAFQNCSSLTDITIPEGVTTIGNDAFLGCTALKTVILPESLESVGVYAFYGCEALSDVYYAGIEMQWSSIHIENYNEPLTGATIHFGGTAEIRYLVPAFAGTETTLIFKSGAAQYSVSAENGVFTKAGVQIGVYKVYAARKNSLTRSIGTYNNALGEVTNFGTYTLPLGDVNRDNVIGFGDASVLLASANYGKPNTVIDLDGDSVITVDDLAIVLQEGNYGAKSDNIA